jgi:mRNA-degrading endonuclease RelE of RelBE toxin-antitoxin system
MAQVIVSPAAQQQFINDVPRGMQRRVLTVLERLERWPAVSGAKPLRGNLSGRFRCRTGDYRIQFIVVANVVTVEKIGHRDGFYGD